MKAFGESVSTKAGEIADSVVEKSCNTLASGVGAIQDGLGALKEKLEKKNLSRMAGIAQGGQQTAQSLGGMGGQYGQNVGGTLGSLSTQLQNNIGQLGNARASGYIGQANAITGGLQGITDNMFRAAGLLYPKGIT